MAWAMTSVGAPGRVVPNPLITHMTAASGAAPAERGLPGVACSRPVQVVKRTEVVARNDRMQIVLRLVTAGG